MRNQLKLFKSILQNSQFLKEFTNFELLPNHSNVLFSFVVGQNAVFIENLQDECLIDVIHEILTKSFPTYNLARPKQIIRFLRIFFGLK